MNVLEKVARTMGEKYDVRIVFAGDRARTDGKVIQLPALPEDLSKMDENMVVKIKGLCDHETGHLKYSSFALLQDIMRLPNAKQVMPMTNLLEDVRIEKLHGGRYLGVKENMNAAFEIMFADPYHMQHPLNKLAYESRRQVCGYVLTKHEDYEDFCKKSFGNDIFDRIAALESSEDSLALALSILGKLKEDMRPKPEAPTKKDDKEQEQDKLGEKKDGTNKEKSKKEKKEDGESGAEGGESEGDNTDEDNNEEDGEGDSGGDSDDADKGDGEKGDKAGMTAGENGNDSTDEDAFDGGDPSKVSGHEEGRSADGTGLTSDEAAEIMKNLENYKDAFDKVKEDLEERHADMVASAYTVLDKSEDEVRVVKEADSTATFDYLKKSLGSLNAAKTKMATMFLTRTASKWLNDRENGKINARSLCRIKTGYTNVFREKYVCKDSDTAITFLVDFSGSMLNENEQRAMQAAVLFLEALQGVKVKSEVLGYTTGRIVGKEKALPHTFHSYGRVEKLITFVFKAFSEPYNLRVKKRISSYSNLTQKENCDPDSVLVAYERLMKRPEKRKILFVLTDGIVANCGDYYAGIKYLKELIPRLMKSGCEVIGVGIGGAHEVKEFYPKSIYISDSGNLADELLKQLKDVLKI